MRFPEWNAWGRAAPVVGTLIRALSVWRAWIVLGLGICLASLAFRLLLASPEHVVAWRIGYAFAALEAALCVAGFFLLASHPVGWIATLGTVATIDFVRALATGEYPMAQLALAAGCWVALPIAVRAQEIAGARSEPYAAHALAGTNAERARLQAHGAEADELLDLGRARALRRAIFAGSIVVAAATAVAAWRIATLETTREDESSPARTFAELGADLDAAWRASDVEAIGDLFGGDDAVVSRGELREGFARRGWLALPALRERVARVDGDAAVVELATASGSVQTYWRRTTSDAEREWSMVRVSLPLPDVAPFADELTTTWNEKGLDAVASLATKEREPSLRRALDDLRATWGGEAPRLGAHATVVGESDRAEVRCDTTSGRIVVGCRLGDGGRWRVERVTVTP